MVKLILLCTGKFFLATLINSILSCSPENKDRVINASEASTSEIEATILVNKTSYTDTPVFVVRLQDTNKIDEDERPSLVLSGNDEVTLEHGTFSRVSTSDFTSRSPFTEIIENWDRSQPFSATYYRDDGEFIDIGEIFLPIDYEIFEPSNTTIIDWREEFNLTWSEPQNSDQVSVAMMINCNPELIFKYSEDMPDSGTWAFTIKELEWQNSNNKNVNDIQLKTCKLSFCLTKENSNAVNKVFHSGSAIARNAQCRDPLLKTL